MQDTRYLNTVSFHGSSEKGTLVEDIAPTTKVEFDFILFLDEFSIYHIFREISPNFVSNP